MKVNVAGAGAGKTTKMADIITNYEIPEDKIIYCIAFTNSAADNIKEKVEVKLGKVPNNIKISTIHSFLLEELIDPYYYFLYGQHFEDLSIINLPTKPKYKRYRLSELERLNTLHITKIPEKAKWVAYKKSNDNNKIKSIREKILMRFSSYCAAIFIDEAQDIDKDTYTVIRALDTLGINIILYGDPKQDVKGFGCFRNIIDNTEDVCYISDSYRCPQKHLNLSNLLASNSEKQVADKKNSKGTIKIIFESDIKDINAYINSGNYGLCYISRKRSCFTTHDKKESKDRFESVRHEIRRAIFDKWSGRKSEFEINSLAFFVAEKMLDQFDETGAIKTIISEMISESVFDRLNKQQYAQMTTAFKELEENPMELVVVKSIEIVKGLESKRCLFILTTDLAPYLFGEKTDDNKTKHLLYVALTRSLEHLTIMITREVEDKYKRNFIVEFFKKNIY